MHHVWSVLKTLNEQPTSLLCCDVYFTPETPPLAVAVATTIQRKVMYVSNICLQAQTAGGLICVPELPRRASVELHPVACVSANTPCTFTTTAFAEDGARAQMKIAEGASSLAITCAIGVFRYCLHTNNIFQS